MQLLEMAEHESATHHRAHIVVSDHVYPACDSFAYNRIESLKASMIRTPCA